MPPLAQERGRSTPVVVPFVKCKYISLKTKSMNDNIDKIVNMKKACKHKMLAKYSVLLRAIKLFIKKLFNHTWSRFWSRSWSGSRSRSTS